MIQKSNKINKPEILSPAGDIEKLKIAFEYGADAVYASGKNFGLRSFAGNFTKEELKEAVEHTRLKNKKIYITVNIFPHNRDIEGIKEHLEYLKLLNVDGIIVSDLGVFMLAKIHAPGIPLHISVQANNVNYEEVKVWKELGAKRIILARELSMEEIKEIKEKVPGIEIEIFVHGAICMSYSGRCLLSNYLTGRDANTGECSQSCRWSYRLSEAKRPGEFLDITEDEKGTYIFNSKDLNLIRRIPELISAGIVSFKIEGRMKNLHYVAVTAMAYSKAVDQYIKDPENYVFEPGFGTELNKISHREYFEGYYFSDGKPGQNTKASNYVYDSRYIGCVSGSEDGKFCINVKHSFSVGAEPEILEPSGNMYKIKITGISDEQGINVVKASQGKDYWVLIDKKISVKKHSIVRISA